MVELNRGEGGIKLIMNKYIIMGVQGCGKGTQATMLMKEFGFVHINVGEILRWNIQNHTKTGAKVKRAVAGGNLISDEIIENIVYNRLQEHNWNYGFVLDGFPRNLSQAEFFLESYNINAVIFINVPDDVVLERVLARRLCSLCGLDYNLIYHRPMALGICDVCGGKLETRPDDNELAIRERIYEYHRQTEPVLELFCRKELVIKVDGTDPQEIVQSKIRKGLGLSSVPK